ncbi:HAD superfamily hydrolase (TIGR01484 family) [Streptacidiphilus sp. MAP12-33]|uniref:HAD family hydrolase n=1 Tax=Streptacidiphilus sp. MAP12-33 TaxID=3156266 RepID=UPI003516C998
MPVPFDLIATDLDGTLLRLDHTVSARNQAALKDAEEAGMRHVVVTGRPANWARGVLDSLGYTGLAVCGQGGQVYDAGADRLLTRVPLDRGDASAALARVEAEIGPLALAVVQDGLDGEVLFGPGFDTPGAGADATSRVRDTGALWTRPIGRVMVQHPGLGDDELAAAVREFGSGLVDAVVAGPTCVEVLPPGLSKAVGLELAAERLDADPARAIAFGDMPNDIPMFAWAGHGVAMANAHPDLAAVADEMTLDHMHDGVAVVVERLLTQV